MAYQRVFEWYAVVVVVMVVVGGGIGVGVARVLVVVVVEIVDEMRVLTSSRAGQHGILRKSYGSEFRSAGK